MALLFLPTPTGEGAIICMYASLFLLISLTSSAYFNIRVIFLSQINKLSVATNNEYYKNYKCTQKIIIFLPTTLCDFHIKFIEPPLSSVVFFFMKITTDLLNAKLSWGIPRLYNKHTTPHHIDTVACLNLAEYGHTVFWAIVLVTKSQ